MLGASEDLTECEKNNHVGMIEVKGKLVPFQIVKANNFYTKWIPQAMPTAVQRWKEEGVDFGNKWSQIYQLAFAVTASTKLQSLQYRILRWYFPTRRCLCIRKVPSGRTIL